MLCYLRMIKMKSVGEELSRDESNKEYNIKYNWDEETSQNGTCSQKKKLKKPDKYLACMRCNNKETMFCY